jgi:hypothetical protein
MVINSLIRLKVNRYVAYKCRNYYCGNVVIVHFFMLKKFYLVDSGYPNRLGYFAPYKGTKYHLSEFRQGPRPRGKKEASNYMHSSLHNVIERAFGVLKMKWQILLDLPSYPMNKQSKIILVCMVLHNFI